GKRSSWIWEPQIHWAQSIDKTELKLLAGLSFQEQNESRLSQSAYGFTSNYFIGNLSAASMIIPISDYKNQYKYNSIFGRINLNHAGKYFLNLTGRRDGSSRFGPNKRFANFGAFGVAWLF